MPRAIHAPGAVADDGFGNLVSLENPFGFATTVYARLEGRLAQFDVGTPDHVEAIGWVRDAIGDSFSAKTRRWQSGTTVLALVPAVALRA